MTLKELNDYCVENNRAIIVKNGLLVGFKQDKPEYEIQVE